MSCPKKLCEPCPVKVPLAVIIINMLDKEEQAEEKETEQETEQENQYCHHRHGRHIIRTAVF